MKRLIFVFLSVICVYVDAYIGILHYYPESNQTSHCYSSITGAMESGEEKRIQDKCEMAICEASRDIKITGCADASVLPPCIMREGDLKKPFPNCCYEIICP